ncbi:MAG TPA: cupin domain-containing protein [Pyrinomonadaceae bacterium]|jgi:ribosomal protein L16 Arg81 hydroxylase|nr:cupin domain-containing protein [Pyrinomonadaceae bacterium]
MAKLDFSYLIAPHAASDFFDQYWELAALLVKRGEAGRHHELIDDSWDASDTDGVLSMAERLPAEAVEVIGRDQPNSAAGDSNGAIAGWFNQGATIRVRAIQRFCEPLGDLCRNIEAELGCPVRANLYCTPANSRGFNLHFDTHEVFVLQLFGKKRWQIFAPSETLPLEFVPRLSFENDREAVSRSRGPGGISETQPGPPALEAVLEPGDCLYLPRGFLHQADAQDEPSVHLTIGIHVLTWLDLLSVALGQTASRHDDLRRALPPGLFKNGLNRDKFVAEFRERVELFARESIFESAVDEIAESFARTRKAGRDDSIENDTALEGNGQLRFYLAADGTMAGLACDEKELWLPAGFASAMRFVAEQRVFKPQQLPGSITDNGKLAFVRHLVRDGFLRLVP